MGRCHWLTLAPETMETSEHLVPETNTSYTRSFFSQLCCYSNRKRSSSRMATPCCFDCNSPSRNRYHSILCVPCSFQDSFDYFCVPYIPASMLYNSGQYNHKLIWLSLTQHFTNTFLKYVVFMTTERFF